MKADPKKRVIVIGENFGNLEISNVRRTLSELVDESNRPILLVINGVDSEAWPCLDLYDTIRLTVKDTLVEVHGMVMGSCCTLSLVILQACSSRSATKHSRFSINHGEGYFFFSSEHSDDSIISRLKETIGVIRNIDESIRSVILSRTGMSGVIYDEMLKFCSLPGNSISAKKALGLRLIDKVTDTLPGKFGL